MSKNRCIGLLLFIVSLTTNAIANEVPDKRTTLIFCPFDFVYDSAYIYEVSEDHGYKTSPYVEGTISNNPKVTLTAFLDAIQSGEYGVIGIESHGDSDSFIVETYKDEETREEAYKNYHDEYGDKINKGEATVIDHSTGLESTVYGIGVTSKFIEEYFKPAKNCIVWNSSCESAEYAKSFLGKAGARNYFGLKGDYSAEQTYPVAKEFWYRIGGKLAKPGDKKRNYTVGEAFDEASKIFGHAYPSGDKKANDEVFYNSPKILEVELKQGTKKSEKVLYKYKYKYGTTYPFYNPADPYAADYPGDLSKCIPKDGKAKTGPLTLRIRFSESMDAQSEGTGTSNNDNVMLKSNSNFKVQYDPQGPNRGAKEGDLTTFTTLGWTDGKDDTGYTYQNGESSGTVTIPNGPWKDYSGVADIIVKARDNFNEDDSSTNPDGELDINGDGQRNDLDQNRWKGPDKNHKFIIVPFVRGIQVVIAAQEIKDVIYTPNVPNQWSQKWDGKTFSAGKPPYKGYSTVLEAIHEFPIELINEKSEIKFLYSKQGGGIAREWQGGLLAGKVSDPSYHNLVAFITAYDRDGNRIGTYSDSSDSSLLNQVYKITVDGEPVKVYAYNVSEKTWILVWHPDPNAPGGGLYIPTTNSPITNPDFHPVEGGVQLKEPLDLISYLKNQLGISDISTITRLKVHLLCVSSDFEGSWQVPLPKPPKEVPPYLVYKVQSTGLDLSPAKSKTQKITIKKKGTKKAEQIAKRAPALESDGIADDDTAELDAEPDNDLGIYSAGDTVVVEGEVESDEEGGVIRGVWCLCDADDDVQWQPAASSDGGFNGTKEGFKYSYLVPRDLPEGDYTIEIKSENGLGDEDTAYENVRFTVGNKAGRNSVYVSPSSSQTISIMPATGEIKAEIPEGTFSDAVTVTLTTTTPPAASGIETIKVSNIALEITNDKGLQPVKDIKVSIAYRDSDITGLEEDKLAIGRYDDSNSRWIVLKSEVNSSQNIVEANVNHISKFALIQKTAAGDLKNVKVYPSPYNPNRHSQGMKIDNLTLTAEIKIYTILGEKVRDVDYTTRDGRAVWDGTNDSGRQVASGVYVMYIKSPVGSRKIKFAVER